MISCGECGKNVDPFKGEYAQVRVTVWNNNHCEILGVVNMHTDCYKRVGLAGRWKDLRASKSA